MALKYSVPQKIEKFDIYQMERMFEKHGAYAEFLSARLTGTSKNTQALLWNDVGEPILTLFQ